MKNLKFKPLNYLFLVAAFFLLATTMVAPSLTVLGISAAVAFVGGTAVSFMPNLKGSLGAIQVEIWQNHIEEEIFKQNDFLRLSHNADDNVISSKVVHIPQSGGSGNVVKNRTSLPAAIRKRTDTDVIYLLDEYTTDPVVIPHADTKELSYDKRASVIGEDVNKLTQVVAENTLYNWLSGGAYGSYAAHALPTAHQLLTTGSTVDAALVGVPGATGNRKGASRADLQRLRSFFVKQNRWFEGQMYGLLDPEMEAQLFPANDIVTATYMNNVTEQERREGVMYKAHGFKLMTRSSVVGVNTDNSIKAPGETSNATDDAASLFWYKEAVEYAYGGVEAFFQEKAPTMYGDVYSFLARSGGRARRADYKGVAILKQAKTS